jgi:hypothetical protein
MNRRLLVPLLSLLACLLVAAPASGAGMTGTWGGETSQDLGLEKPYTTNIGFSVLNGRIINVVAEVRMQCGESSIQDVRVSKSYRTSSGPRLGAKGGFNITVQGARIGGKLTRKAGAGNISASKGECSGKGSWSVSRRKN